jgi:hypothetical protein
VEEERTYNAVGGCSEQRSKGREREREKGEAMFLRQTAANLGTAAGGGSSMSWGVGDSRVGQ